MTKPVPVKSRSRAGTYQTFVKRYEPIDALDGGISRPWNDPEILAADLRHVWTIVDGDTGERCYIVPGFATVNYIGRVLCSKPWPDEEEYLPGYAW